MSLTLSGSGDGSACRTGSGFLDKELSGRQLTTQLLTSLLHQETERKAALEQQEKELAVQRERRTLGRGTGLAVALDVLLHSIQTLKTNLLQLQKSKLPNPFTNTSFYHQLNQLHHLERIAHYFTLTHFFAHVSAQIRTNVKQGQELVGIDHLDRLRHLQSQHFHGTECVNLERFLADTIQVWETQLEIKFERDFSGLIEEVGWPLRLHTVNPSEETLQKFYKAAKCLSRVHIPKPAKVKPSLLVDFQDSGRIILEILLTPLRKRFKFHFCGNKPTSDPNRPDWYYAQIREWITDMCPWLQKHLSPISGTVVPEFIQGLAELIALKTDSLLACDTLSDSLFSKLLEESIRFETEVQEMYPECSPEIPSLVNTIFSQPHVLTRWISIEQRAALAKLDELFPSSSAWDRAVVPGPSEIASLFIIMLQFLVDRFSYLRQPGQKLQFLKLLVEVLDDFKVRCYQVWKSRVGERDFAIVDTLHYVQLVVREWEQLPFFSSLGEFRDNLENAALQAQEASPLENIGISAQGLFSKIIQVYQNLSTTIFNEWSSTALDHVEAQLVKDGYLKRKWFSSNQSIEFGEPESLSPELIPVIEYLAQRVKNLYAGMDPDLAREWIEKLCRKIDILLIDQLFLKNSFTLKSMVQVQYDFLEGLFPTFPIPSSITFPQSTAVFRIWELPSGNAILLYETLVDPDVREDYKKETIEEGQVGALRMGTLIKLLHGRLQVH